MKTSIWKFELSADTTKLEMPKGAKILTIQTQRELPCIWAVVNPDAEKESRTFDIYGTGHGIFDVEQKKYIGTFQLNGGSFVFHVFEV